MSHFSREHTLNTVEPDDLKPEFYIQAQETPNLTQVYNDSEIMEVDESYEYGEPGTSHNENDKTTSNENLEKALGIFFLKMQVIWHIPESAVQDLSETFFTLYNCALQQAMVKMQTSFDENIAKEILKEVFNKYGKFSTNYRRKLFFTQELPYISPRNENLSVLSIFLILNVRIFLEQIYIDGNDTSQKMAYIPISETLKAVFEHTEIWSKINLSNECELK